MSLLPYHVAWTPAEFVRMIDSVDNVGQYADVAFAMLFLRISLYLFFFYLTFHWCLESEVRFLLLVLSTCVFLVVPNFVTTGPEW